jgi:hypothetical protein
MKPFELLVALIFLVLAVRSAVYWARHRVEGTDLVDEALFASFVTGRVGTWLAASALFALFGTIRVQGRAYVDEAGRYRWFLVVFLLLGAMQLLGAWFLGARGPEGDEAEHEGSGSEPRGPAVVP